MGVHELNINLEIKPLKFATGLHPSVCIKLQCAAQKRDHCDFKPIQGTYSRHQMHHTQRNILYCSKIKN